MRYRERERFLRDYYGKTEWIFSQVSQNRQSGGRYKSFIYDVAHGRGSANPLHSHQSRILNHPVKISVLPDGANGNYRGDCGLDLSSLILDASAPTSIQSAHAWAAKGYASAADPNIGTPPIMSMGEAVEGIAPPQLRSGKILENFARLWFFWNFGLRPTANAVVDVIGLDTRIEKYARRLITRIEEPIRRDLYHEETSTNSSGTGNIFPYSSGFGPGVYRVHHSTDKTYSDRIWFTVIRRLNIAKWSSKGDLLAHVTARVSGIRPVSLAYELTPYSWLVDYVIPIGSIIEALESKRLFSWVRPCLMHETVTTSRRSGILKYVNPSGNVRTVTPSAYVTSTVKRRYPAIAPLPGLTLRPPNPVQLTNIAALIGSKFS